MPDAVPYVQQHLLDAVGQWAERSTGLRAQHSAQNATGPIKPYLSLEWLSRPAATSPRVERLWTDQPTSGLITVTANVDEYAAVVVNLARRDVRRGLLETLSEATDRLAALLVGPLAGRVALERVGEDQIALTPVTAGDLWRLASVVGATVSTAGSVSARIIERIYSGELRVWVIGGAVTAGAAGIAGTGQATGELAAKLTEDLVEPWCRELFDSYGVRCTTPEPRPVTSRGRRGSATHEDRAYIDIELSITARFSAPPKPTTGVVFGVKLEPPAPIEAETVNLEVEIDAEP